MALRSFHKCFVSALLAVAVNTCLTYGDTNNLHGIGSSWSCKPAQISVPNSGSLRAIRVLVVHLHEPVAFLHVLSKCGSLATQWVRERDAGA